MYLKDFIKSPSLMQKSKNLTQFIKFIVVGIVNTLFGYSIFALLLWLNFHYTLAVILGTIIGVIFNFFTTGKIVFNNKKMGLIFKFILAYCFILVLNIVCLAIADHFGLNLYYAGLVLSGIMAVISFLLQKLFVFKENY